MHLAVKKTISTTLPEDLRRQIQDFVDTGGFTNMSEAFNVLLVRGLYITDTPKGKWSESAWIAAYHSARAAILQSMYRRFMGDDLKDIIEKAFQEAMRRSGENVL